MLSTITIISIFIEIFTAGILLAGAFTLIKNLFLKREAQHLFSGLAFSALFINVAATLASQMMFNFGRALSELILMHKIIAASLVLCSVLLWPFVFERLSLKFMRWSYLLMVLFSGVLIYRIFSSGLNLIYREGIVEPIVLFSQAIPIKPFFASMCVLLAVGAFAGAWRERGGQRRLLLNLGGSGIIFLLSMAAAFLYVRFGESIYLLISWVLTLTAVLSFFLAEIIPAASSDALHPLRFLKTRVLFKLLLVFVLLIIILFEATTLATIYIGKNALSAAIKGSYVKLAEGLAGGLESQKRPPSFDELQQLVLQTRLTDKTIAFIVDGKGNLLSHPDRKRVLQRENLMINEGVRQLLQGGKGGAEFRDELGKLMVGAYAPVPKFGWGVVVEEPIASAYFELRRLETNSLLFVIAGIAMTALVGIFFAHSLEKPIKELTVGTEAVAHGDLHWSVSVDSLDEIGRLAAAFNQMTKELRDSQERLILSEKLSSLGTMAAGMAHEIKNPLVSIRTFTQLLQQKWDDQEFRNKFSSIIPHEIDRINRIAESLLKFGKPLRPELSKVDINSLLEEVLMLFESESKKSNVRVTKMLATLPEITGDAGQLQQVFVNIVKNAIEAMHEKGGELIVKTDVGEVVHLGKLSREGKQKGAEMVWGEEEELIQPVPAVFIEVTDTGEGIPEENLKSLFDPFFTTKMTGTGMGLPITLRIIEEHKGSIKIRSHKGKGTTFIITLPEKI